MVHHRWSPICLFALAATTISAGAQPAPPSQSHCFFINQFESWRAPDPTTIYIRVQLNRYYRLELAGACPEITWPNSHLITKTRGPDTICSAVDWDLSVSQYPGGIPTPCIVKTMTLLGPKDVAAIPKKYKP